MPGAGREEQAPSPALLPHLRVLWLEAAPAEGIEWLEHSYCVVPVTLGLDAAMVPFNSSNYRRKGLQRSWEVLVEQRGGSRQGVLPTASQETGRQLWFPLPALGLRRSGVKEVSAARIPPMRTNFYVI